MNRIIDIKQALKNIERRQICTQSLWDKRFKELNLNVVDTCYYDYEVDIIMEVKYILNEIFCIKSNKKQSYNLWCIYSASLSGSWLFLYPDKAIAFLEEFINKHIINDTSCYTKYFPKR